MNFKFMRDKKARETDEVIKFIIYLGLILATSAALYFFFRQYM